MAHMCHLHCVGSSSSTSSRLCQTNKQSEHLDRGHSLQSWPHLPTLKQHKRSASWHHCPELAAAAAAGPQPSQAAVAAALQEPLIRLSRPKRRLSWQRWERKLFEQLLEANQEQV